MADVSLTIDQRALLKLGRALKAEANGKELRRDLIREMRKPLTPIVAEIKSGVMAMSSGGLPTQGEPLRSAVARKIKSEIKLSGKAIGVRIRARKTEATRQFRNAPKRLNSPKGWRRQVFGSDVWVVQMGKPRYFDEPLEGRRDEFKSTVRQAMDSTARRLTIRIKV